MDVGWHQDTKEFLKKMASLADEFQPRAGSMTDVEETSTRCPDGALVVLTVDEAHALCGDDGIRSNYEAPVFTHVLSHLVDYPLACTIFSTEPKLNAFALRPRHHPDSINSIPRIQIPTGQ
jgi:hypothetical protein